ncbi:hypothetical protein Pla175_36440 [Pirellulimonas nuda]|uniref:DUF2946 domain-containing protein n=1 Tax=Pirellulimonas nuda TaxID=2528009 RepID=A0A518DFM9_9BACT|nr:hypothetical protein [Pirellulimonas nuda]QDU90242.1 hypothetical protein Pla175_36440 [Pirellulimonas nuda]
MDPIRLQDRLRIALVVLVGAVACGGYALHVALGCMHSEWTCAPLQCAGVQGENEQTGPAPGERTGLESGDCPLCELLATFHAPVALEVSSVHGGQVGRAPSPTRQGPTEQGACYRRRPRGPPGVAS